jgi:hypothetical protein
MFFAASPASEPKQIQQRQPQPPLPASPPPSAEVTTVDVVGTDAQDMLEEFTELYGHVRGDIFDHVFSRAFPIGVHDVRDVRPHELSEPQPWAVPVIGPHTSMITNAFGAYQWVRQSDMGNTHLDMRVLLEMVSEVDEIASAAIDHLIGRHHPPSHDAASMIHDVDDALMQCAWELDEWRGFTIPPPLLIIAAVAANPSIDYSMVVLPPIVPGAHRDINPEWVGRPDRCPPMVRGQMGECVSKFLRVVAAFCGNRDMVDAFLAFYNR